MNTPSTDELAHVLGALDAYRKTSPEMVVVGRMIAEALPPLDLDMNMPSTDEFAHVLGALDAYRKTSPEMVVVGRMIAESLPDRTG